MLFCNGGFRCALLSLVLCAASIALVQAQQDRTQLGAPSQSVASQITAPSPAKLDEILTSENQARTIAQVAVSPDGKRIAWLEAGQIRVAPIDNLSQSQPVTAAAPGNSCNASDLIWSPDSASIAFLSDCDTPGQQSDLFLSSRRQSGPSPH